MDDVGGIFISDPLLVCIFVIRLLAKVLVVKLLFLSFLLFSLMEGAFPDLL